MAFNYQLQYSIEGGTITEISINRPTIGNIDAVKTYVADGPEIWMGRLLVELTTLTLAQTAQIDLADIRVLLNIVSKL